MNVRKWFALKLLFRAMVAMFFLGIYLTNRQLLDFTSDKPWEGMYILGGIILLGLLTKFLPLKTHPVGMRKYLYKNFVPTEHYKKSGINDKDRRYINERNKDGARVFFFYLFLNGVIITLYILGLFGVPEIVMIMLFYYVGDMVCVNVFCPFKLIFMKNRCCNQCRIYNWDSIMLVIPLVAVPSLYSFILLTPALIYTVMWEVSWYRHPERFLESCNESLKCANCTHGLCPLKRRKSMQEMVSDIKKNE